MDDSSGSRSSQSVNETNLGSPPLLNSSLDDDTNTSALNTSISSVNDNFQKFESFLDDYKQRTKEYYSASEKCSTSLVKSTGDKSSNLTELVIDKKPEVKKMSSPAIHVPPRKPKISPASFHGFDSPLKCPIKPIRNGNKCQKRLSCDITVKVFDTSGHLKGNACIEPIAPVRKIQEKYQTLVNPVQKPPRRKISGGSLKTSTPMPLFSDNNRGSLKMSDCKKQLFNAGEMIIAAGKPASAVGASDCCDGMVHEDCKNVEKPGTKLLGILLHHPSNKHENKMKHHAVFSQPLITGMRLLDAISIESMSVPSTPEVLVPNSISTNKPTLEKAHSISGLTELEHENTSHLNVRVRLQRKNRLQAIRNRLRNAFNMKNSGTPCWPKKFRKKKKLKRLNTPHVNLRGTGLYSTQSEESFASIFLSNEQKVSGANTSYFDNEVPIRIFNTEARENVEFPKHVTNDQNASPRRKPITLRERLLKPKLLLSKDSTASLDSVALKKAYAFLENNIRKSSSSTESKVKSKKNTTDSRVGSIDSVNSTNLSSSNPKMIARVESHEDNPTGDKPSTKKISLKTKFFLRATSIPDIAPRILRAFSKSNSSANTNCEQNSESASSYQLPGRSNYTRHSFASFLSEETIVEKEENEAEASEDITYHTINAVENCGKDDSIRNELRKTLLCNSISDTDKVCSRSTEELRFNWSKMKTKKRLSVDEVFSDSLSFSQKQRIINAANRVIDQKNNTKSNENLAAASTVPTDNTVTNTEADENVSNELNNAAEEKNGKNDVSGMVSNNTHNGTPELFNDLSNRFSVDIGCKTVLDASENKMCDHVEMKSFVTDGSIISSTILTNENMTDKDENKGRVSIKFDEKDAPEDTPTLPIDALVEQTDSELENKVNQIRGADEKHIENGEDTIDNCNTSTERSSFISKPKHHDPQPDIDNSSDDVVIKDFNSIETLSASKNSTGIETIVQYSNENSDSCKQVVREMTKSESMCPENDYKPNIQVTYNSTESCDLNAENIDITETCRKESCNDVLNNKINILGCSKTHTESDLSNISENVGGNNSIILTESSTSKIISEREVREPILKHVDSYEDILAIVAIDGDKIEHINKKHAKDEGNNLKSIDDSNSCVVVIEKPNLEQRPGTIKRTQVVNEWNYGQRHDHTKPVEHQIDDEVKNNKINVENSNFTVALHNNIANMENLDEVKNEAENLGKINTDAEYSNSAKSDVQTLEKVVCDLNNTNQIDANGVKFNEDFPSIFQSGTRNNNIQLRDSEDSCYDKTHGDNLINGNTCLQSENTVNIESDQQIAITGDIKYEKPIIPNENGSGAKLGMEYANDYISCSYTKSDDNACYAKTSAEDKIKLIAKHSDSYEDILAIIATSDDKIEKITDKTDLMSRKDNIDAVHLNITKEPARESTIETDISSNVKGDIEASINANVHVDDFSNVKTDEANLDNSNNHDEAFKKYAEISSNSETDVQNSDNINSDSEYTSITTIDADISGTIIANDKIYDNLEIVDGNDGKIKSSSEHNSESICKINEYKAKHSDSCEDILAIIALDDQKIREKIDNSDLISGNIQTNDLPSNTNLVKTDNETAINTKVTTEIFGISKINGENQTNVETDARYSNFAKSNSDNANIDPQKCEKDTNNTDDQNDIKSDLPEFNDGKIGAENCNNVKMNVEVSSNTKTDETIIDQLKMTKRSPDIEKEIAKSSDKVKTDSENIVCVKTNSENPSSENADEDMISKFKVKLSDSYDDILAMIAIDDDNIGKIVNKYDLVSRETETCGLFPEAQCLNSDEIKTEFAGDTTIKNDGSVSSFENDRNYIGASEDNSYDSEANDVRVKMKTDDEAITKENTETTIETLVTTETIVLKYGDTEVAVTEKIGESSSNIEMEHENKVEGEINNDNNTISSSETVCVADGSPISKSNDTKAQNISLNKEHDCNIPDTAISMQTEEFSVNDSMNHKECERSWGAGTSVMNETINGADSDIAYNNNDSSPEVVNESVLGYGDAAESSNDDKPKPRLKKFLKRGKKKLKLGFSAMLLKVSTPSPTTTLKRDPFQLKNISPDIDTKDFWDRAENDKGSNSPCDSSSAAQAPVIVLDGVEHTDIIDPVDLHLEIEQECELNKYNEVHYKLRPHSHLLKESDRRRIRANSILESEFEFDETEEDENGGENSIRKQIMEGLQLKKDYLGSTASFSSADISKADSISHCSDIDQRRKSMVQVDSSDDFFDYFRDRPQEEHYAHILDSDSENEQEKEIVKEEYLASARRSSLDLISTGSSGSIPKIYVEKGTLAKGETIYSTADLSSLHADVDRSKYIDDDVFGYFSSNKTVFDNGRDRIHDKVFENDQNIETSSEDTEETRNAVNMNNTTEEFDKNYTLSAEKFDCKQEQIQKDVDSNEPTPISNENFGEPGTTLKINKEAFENGDKYTERSLMKNRGPQISVESDDVFVNYETNAKNGDLNQIGKAQGTDATDSASLHSSEARASVSIIVTEEDGEAPQLSNDDYGKRNQPRSSSISECSLGVDGYWNKYNHTRSLSVSDGSLSADGSIPEEPHVEIVRSSKRLFMVSRVYSVSTGNLSMRRVTSNETLVGLKPSSSTSDLGGQAVTPSPSRKNDLLLSDIVSDDVLKNSVSVENLHSDSNALSLKKDQKSELENCLKASADNFDNNYSQFGLNFKSDSLTVSSMLPSQRTEFGSDVKSNTEYEIKQKFEPGSHPMDGSEIKSSANNILQTNLKSISIIDNQKNILEDTSSTISESTLTLKKMDSLLNIETQDEKIPFSAPSEPNGKIETTDTSSHTEAPLSIFVKADANSDAIPIIRNLSTSHEGLNFLNTNNDTCAKHNSIESLQAFNSIGPSYCHAKKALFPNMSTSNLVQTCSSFGLPGLKPAVLLQTWNQRQKSEEDIQSPKSKSLVRTIMEKLQSPQASIVSLGRRGSLPSLRRDKIFDTPSSGTPVDYNKEEDSTARVEERLQKDRSIDVYPETLRQRQRNMSPSPSKVDIKNWSTVSTPVSTPPSEGSKKYLPSVKALRSQFESGKGLNNNGCAGTISPTHSISSSSSSTGSLPNNTSSSTTNPSTSHSSNIHTRKVSASSLASSLLEEKSNSNTSLNSAPSTENLLDGESRDLVMSNEPVEPIFCQFQKMDEELREMIDRPTSTTTWDPKQLLKHLYHVPDMAKSTHTKSSSFINIEGYLEKLPSGRKKSTFWNAWKKRYFVAKDGVLYCYQNSQCEKATLRLTLMGGKVETMDGDMVGVDDGKGHYIVMRCTGGQQEVDKWRRALLTHTTTDDFVSQYVLPQPLPTNPSMFKDALVVDIGSCSVRAGVLSAVPALPMVFYPTVMASKQGGSCWGAEALTPDYRSSASLSFPIRPTNRITKYSVDLTAVTSILSKTFSDLKVDPKNYNLQLSVPRPLTQHTQAELLRILFEKFGLKGVNITHQSILALYAYNATSGIVVDIGERMDIVPVIDGYIVDGGVSRVPYGGNRILDHLRQFLYMKNVSLVNDVESYLIRHVLESVCYCAQHYNTEKARCSNNPQSYEKKVSLKEFFPNKAQCPYESVTLDFGRFQTTEGLFNPDAWGLDHPGVHKLVHKAIQECSMDIRREMSRSIFLAGGVTQLPGFAERLATEVDNLTPAAIRPKVHVSPYRYHAAYLGACTLAASTAFTQTIISKEYWSKSGNTALRKWGL